MKRNFILAKSLIQDEITFSNFSGRLMFYLQRNDDFFGDDALANYGNFLIDSFSNAQIKEKDEQNVTVTIKTTDAWDSFLAAIKCGFHVSKNHLLSFNAARMASIKEYAFSVEDENIIKELEND